MAWSNYKARKLNNGKSYPSQKVILRGQISTNGTVCRDVFNDVKKTDGDRIIHRDRVIEKREFTKERGKEK